MLAAQLAVTGRHHCPPEAVPARPTNRGGATTDCNNVKELQHEDRSWPDAGPIAVIPCRAGLGATAQADATARNPNRQHGAIAAGPARAARTACAARTAAGTAAQLSWGATGRCPHRPVANPAAAWQTGAMVTPADLPEIKALLIAAARAGRDPSYSEMLLALGYRFSRPKMRSLCRLLDAIDEAGRATGEPELAVLVVRESDRLPGQGWWVGRRDAPADWTGPAARAFVTVKQRAAFAWWQDR